MSKTRSIVLLAITFISVVIAVVKATRIEEYTGWNVFLEYVSVSSVGDAEFQKPTFFGTVMTDYQVTFEHKEDAVTYQIKIVNLGDYQAKLTSIVKSIPHCEGDEELCKNLKYSITSFEGEELPLGTVIRPHSEKEVKVRIEALVEPSSKTTIDNLDVDFLFQKIIK